MISLDLRTFAYDDGVGLTDIAFSIDAGEQLLVVGASGSGKSTLARLLAGQFDTGQGHRFTGSLTVSGQQLRFDGSASDPRIDPATWAAHVGYVGQRAHAHLSMVCATVAEEIAFGLSNRGVPATQMHALVKQTAERVGLTHLLERDPRQLSGGELQRTCIAAAVIGAPELLVLDEPFKGLDVAGRREIEVLLAQLRRAGTAILQFEPLLPARNPSWKRVIALADGTAVFDGPGAAVSQVGVRAYGIGVEETAAAEPFRNPDERGGEPSVQLRNVKFSYRDNPVLSIAEFSACSGDVIAVTGPNGSGKSTLLQHLNGLLRPEAGTVRLHGQEISGKPTGSLATTVGYLFQDTDQQLFELTVLRETSYGPRAGGRSRSQAQQVALQVLNDVGLQHEIHTHPHELGYRQRRLLALASIMATGPDIWVLDEPTAGMDARGREVLAHLIRRHSSNGGTVLMATHDMGFAEVVCTRRIRIDEGAVAETWRY